MKTQRLISRRGILRWLSLTLLGATLIAGCAGKPDKPPPKLSLEIEATRDLNLGPGGQPLPVVLRVYELKGQGTFLTADFYGLFDRESAVLGADLIGREELTLRPGQVLRIQRPLDPQTAYLGVLAAYRDIDRSRWRATTGITPGADNAIRIVVAAEAVSAYAP
jgi:type VI secretion system protein VasD